jgi:isoquinoline 1-oxidoreductase beta subunit
MTNSTNTLNTTRRNFLLGSAAIGGGFSLGFALPAGKVRAAEAAGPERINIWVEVATDDTVTIRYARSEMGQGSFTSAPQLVADELDANWDQVRIEYVDVNEHMRNDRAWGDMATVGSQTIRGSQEYLRKAGATARAMLISAAAQQWGVPASEITVSNGVVAHAASGKQSGFGALAELAATQPVPENVSLKDPSQWTIIGESVPRRDIPPSVDGTQVYGIDISLPGMVYAAIAQSPVFGGKVATFDAESARAKRGIIDIFPIDNDTALVVVADNWWRAKQALDSIEITWDENGNGNVDDASLREFFRAGLDAADAAPLPANAGNVDEALASAAKVVEAEYYTPYLSHSPMEPMGATVQIGADQVEVWASTQSADAVATEVAGALDIPPQNVIVHRVQAGGGFGRRGGTGDYGKQAALIAQRLPANTPVKLLWTREEDTQHGFYRPLAMYRLKAGLDANNNIVGWRSRIASGSLFAERIGAPLPNGIDPMATEGFTRLPYRVANQDQAYKVRTTHVPIGFWRTVGWSQTPFAREQFIDELAHAAGEDPLAFRLRHMAEDEKSRMILEAAAETAGWSKAPAAGVFRGIATTEPYASFTAAVVELSVDSSGGIKIHRIVQAIDSGYVVNPDNIVAQLQGATVWALSAAMWGEINIERGRVKQANFHDYRLLRLGEMPKVDVVLKPTGGFWGGVGEPGQAPLLPAFCNALFAATGKRIRELPIYHQGFRFV